MSGHSGHYNVPERVIFLAKFMRIYFVFETTYRSRVGTDFRGYFGLRGKAKVFGRRNVTLVRTLRVRVPNGPLTTFNA